jgi:hypothetical protein
VALSTALSFPFEEERMNDLGTMFLAYLLWQYGSEKHKESEQ